MRKVIVLSLIIIIIVLMSLPTISLAAISLSVSPASAPADTTTGFTFRTQAATSGGEVQFKLFHDFNNNGMIDINEWPLIDVVLSDNGDGWINEDFSPDSDPSSPNITTVLDINVCNNNDIFYYPVGNFIIQVMNALGETWTAPFSITPSISSQTVTGTVYEEGTTIPVPNALCECEYINGDDILTVAFTDSNGKYTLQAPTLGDVEINCEKYGYTEAGAPPLSVPVGGISNLNLYLKPTDTWITGTVTESGTGNPVWGAEVWAEEAPNEDYETTTTTDINGSFTLPALSGSVNIGAVKYGYIETWDFLTIPPGGVSGHNITMTPTTTQITGTVMELGTTSPICGAEIEVRTSEGWSWNDADIDGSFILPVLSGEMQGCVEQDGYMTSCSTFTVPSSGISNFNVYLTPMDTLITGTITESGTGNPISGVEVAAQYMSTWSEAVTDSNGNYIIPALSGIEWIVKVYSVPGYYIQTLLTTPTVAGPNILDFIAKPLVTSSCSSADLSVKAYIDGRSHLLIKGSNVWWHHYDYIAPGIFDGSNPTVLNCAEWFPEWSSNTWFCDCDSSSYGNLLPPLSANGSPIELRVIDGSGTVSIVQQPSQSNDFTAIVEFNDDLPGPYWYDIVLSYESTNLTLDIKANNSDGPITIETSETLSVEISLTANDHVGQECDWWVFADTPSGMQYYDFAQGFVTGLSVTYQAAVNNLGSSTILNTSGLTDGTYTYYFGIDLDKDGELDMTEGLFYYDSVEVTVAKPAIESLPAPTITANGSEGPVNINAGDQLLIVIDLDPKSYSGASADWYMAVDTPSGWQSFDLSQMDFSTSGISALLQDYGLISLGSTEIFSTSSLSAGTYTYYFAIDLSGQLYYDSVVVNVQWTAIQLFVE